MRAPRLYLFVSQGRELFVMMNRPQKPVAFIVVLLKINGIDQHRPDTGFLRIPVSVKIIFREHVYFREQIWIFFIQQVSVCSNYVIIIIVPA